jgi:NSS family neurotransmitter:Na+ symporter
MAIVILVVGGGIRAGIERASLILLPTLGVLILGLAIWAATLSGAGPGYAFYLQPDFSELFTFDTLSAAAGQAFFSLSLGMGAMLTYASYIDRDTNLAKEGGQIAFTDASVAFVGGLVTFPIIFHFALSSAVGESTVGALFIALPRGFHALGPTGILVGAVFFIALYIAALTSAFSLLEVATAPIIDGLGWPRRKAVLAAGGAVALVGIPSALDTDFLSLVDKWVGEVALVFGGVMIAILVGYLWRAQADAELAKGMPNAALRRGWFFLLRFVVPVLLVLALIGVVKPLITGN